MRNLVFSDLDKVMDAVETSLHHLHESPQILRSMTTISVDHRIRSMIITCLIVIIYE
jgi:hypothetical protein